MCFVQFLEQKKKLGFTEEEVNKKNKNGHTSLIVAINANKTIVAEALVQDFKADVNVRFGKDSDTALHLACQNAAQKLQGERMKEHKEKKEQE